MCVSCTQTQYHTHWSGLPEQAEGLLITEKVRGAGANLVNTDGEQFVFEREPRDIESASIIGSAPRWGRAFQFRAWR